MTKKHYEAIAFTIDRAREKFRDDHDATRALDDLARSLAVYFKQDNPSFQRSRFLAACGIL